MSKKKYSKINRERVASGNRKKVKKILVRYELYFSALDRLEDYETEQDRWDEACREADAALALDDLYDGAGFIPTDIM